MGFEHSKWKADCGCVHHHTYQDACGMGAIDGTSKKWIEKCANHRREELEKENQIMIKKIQDNLFLLSKLEDDNMTINSHQQK